MQRERDVQEGSNASSSAFGGLGEKISSILGKSRSFGSFFGSNRPQTKETPPDDLPRASKGNKSSEPIIEELDTDDDDEDEVNENGENRPKTHSSSWANRNPRVEHPEDQADDHKEIKNMRKNSSFGNFEGTKSVSYRRVTYGGINGAYLTASTTRRTGSDGRVWEETRHADTTTGEAQHRISRGIHDKGHVLTRKLKSDGTVDTMETLHNLEQDDLDRFERDWKRSGGKHHQPGWDDGLDFHLNRARMFNPSRSLLTNWESPFRDAFVGLRSDLDIMARPSGGRSKKVVTINIE